MLDDTDRKWWPQDLLDEAMPAGRDHPTAWIKGPAGDVYEIANGNDAIDVEEHGDVLERVKPGDVVAFCYCDRLGTIEVDFHDDGSFVAKGEIPPGANWCWIQYDSDTISEALEQLAANLGDGLGGADVEFAHWSEPIDFRLVIDAEGKPQFERVSARVVQ